MEKLDKKVMEELSAKLLEEKARLEKELSQFAKPTGSQGDFETQHDVLGESQDDNATEVEEYVDNLALESNLEGQLKEAIAALQRMEDGKYGYCDNCSQMMSLDRLRAYPAARKCIRCQ